MCAAKKKGCFRRTLMFIGVIYAFSFLTKGCAPSEPPVNITQQQAVHAMVVAANNDMFNPNATDGAEDRDTWNKENFYSYNTRPNFTHVHNFGDGEMEVIDENTVKITDLELDKYDGYKLQEPIKKITASGTVTRNGDNFIVKFDDDLPYKVGTVDQGNCFEFYGIEKGDDPMVVPLDMIDIKEEE